MSSPSWDRGATSIALLSDWGLPVPEFRAETLQRLRTLLNVDAAFFATVDPTTLLFTSALADEPLAAATPLFLENEFGCADVNKFATLANSTDPVGSLDGATGGDRIASRRYREVMRPLGLGDELRVALRSGGRCWGVLCLHREDGVLGFNGEELTLLRRLAPHLGDGLRRGLAIFPITREPPGVRGPGVIILGPDLSVISVNPQAEWWLSQLMTAEWTPRLDLPFAICAAASQHIERDPADTPPPAPTRIPTDRGGWITVQASPLKGPTGPQVAVVIDAADGAQLSSLVLSAHGLTPAQIRVAALVLQGRSTRQIIDELRISSNTVQEHLHQVFHKFGIGSRRELVAILLGPKP